MRQVYVFRIDKNDEVYGELKEISKIAKDLYNQALWEVKEHYKKTGKMLSYSELDKLMKTKGNLEGTINYRLLPAKVAQQVLKLVAQNVFAFCKALADYKVHPEKYQGRPHFPYLLPKDGYFVVIFTNQQATIRENGTIKLTKKLAVSMPEKEFEKYRDYFIQKIGKKI